MMQELTQEERAARIRKLGDLRGLGPQDLANRAKIQLRQVTRARDPKHPSVFGPKTLVALAKALEVDLGVLTGELPMPEEKAKPSAVMKKTRIEVSTATNNMAVLVGWHLRVPAALIYEWAAFAALALAYESLEQRASRLDKLRAANEARTALSADYRHLPMRSVFDPMAEEAINAEASSLANRDIFGEEPAEASMFKDEAWDDDVDTDRDNPLARSWRDKVNGLNLPAKVEAISRFRTDYEVGKDEALRLCSGDEKLANAVLSGEIDLNDMPRKLLTKGTGPERLEWLRLQAEAHRMAVEKEVPLGDLFIEGEDTGSDKGAAP